MRSPDRWAVETGRGSSVPWHERIPEDVKQLVAVSTQGPQRLVSWFHEEVAAHYPDEAWPKEATRHKCEKLIEAVRRAAA